MAAETDFVELANQMAAAIAVVAERLYPVASDGNFALDQARQVVFIAYQVSLYTPVVKEVEQAPA